MTGGGPLRWLLTTLGASVALLLCVCLTLFATSVVRSNDRLSGWLLPTWSEPALPCSPPVAP